MEFLGLAQGLLGAHEILEGSFTVRYGHLRPGDIFFQFMAAFFHLLALDRIQALLSWIGLQGLLAIFRRFGRELRFQSRLKSSCRSLRPIFAPKIILIVAGINLDAPAADLE